MFQALIAIAESNALPFIHAQLHAGTPTDTAIRATIAFMGAHIPNKTVETYVEKALNGLVNGLEEAESLVNPA